jgi:uncharacterized membrane protein
MSNYPEAVTTIVNDYLDRVRLQLRPVPAREQDEFLREIESHVFEAYQQTPGEDDVARILAVLRRLGEPAELVADRLPQTMVRSGASRNLPLYILSGIFIALFGIPLGFGGVGVLLGLLGALFGVVVAYFAVTGSILLVGALFMVLGLIRLFLPTAWDNLVALGVIQMKDAVGAFFDQLPAFEQGIVMIVCAALLLAAGLGMLWLGRYLIRGMRFLSILGFDWTRRLAQSARRTLASNRAKPAMAAAAQAHSAR